jgi:DNA modification methylase
VSAIVLRGDAAHLPLPDASVDLIVTSPPYFGQRDYRDGGESLAGQIGSEETPAEYVAALLRCTREWMRALKPSGSLFVNLGDSYYSGKGAPGKTTTDPKNAGRNARRTTRSPLDYGLDLPRKTLIGAPWRYALSCIDDLGLILRAEIVWDKPNGLPESVTDRVRRSHEQVFHLVKQPRYFSAADEIREPGTGRGAATWADRKAGGEPGRQGEQRITFPNGMAPHPLGKLPGSVWEIASQPLIVPDSLDVGHFAAFPMELPRRIILGWSPPSGIVVDPFGGTGTTSLVADVLGRTGITVDRSADYCRIARWRTADPAERARALGVPKPPPVPQGQASLFDLKSTARPQDRRPA